MTTDLLPDALREALGNEIEPVRPLSPAWRRTLVVTAVATGVTVVALATFSLRFDLDQIPLWLGWGASMLELLVGLLIIGLALREAIPGAGVPAGTARLSVATAVVLQMVVGLTTWMHSAGMPMGDDWMSKSVMCLKSDTSLVLPIFAVTFWLVFRALPLRAPMAGLLGGGGAALAGDAINHLLCPMSDLRHVLMWHTGALLGFMAIGAVFGWLWQRFRWR
jgi:hypothetical protein